MKGFWSQRTPYRVHVASRPLRAAAFVLCVGARVVLLPAASLPSERKTPMTIAATLRAEPGEVFTRRWIVETILDLVGYTSDRDLAMMRLVEPSIGSGAFFVPIVERLLASAQRHERDLASLGDALFGIDLRQRHVDTCRQQALHLLMRAGASPEEAELIAGKWLHCGDFLLADIPHGVDFVVYERSLGLHLC